jgi:hypothetical protein
VANDRLGNHTLEIAGGWPILFSEEAATLARDRGP